MADWRIGRLALIFLPAFVLFCIGAITDIKLPGVYMDAVNPDYLIIRLLNPHHAAMGQWTLPGTMLFGRLPVIGQIYHGALPYYVGLPFYALFGTGVVGIRLTNMVFGLTVLSGTGAFMCAFHTRPLIAALSLALLALDPGFLFSFRTQFYITLLPVAALLASAAIIEMRGETPTRRIALLSGLLSGLACYGYFIYGFLVPAVALFGLYRWSRRPDLKQLVLCWIGGFLIGVLPYFIAFLLIFGDLGTPRKFAAFMLAAVQAQNAQGDALSLPGAVRVFIGFVRDTILDIGPTSMMLKYAVPMMMPQLKTALLILVPGVAIVSGILRPSRVRGLLLLGGILLGFFPLALLFGGHLWLHHAALMLPLLYAALALALERFASLLVPAHPRLVGAVVVIALVPFLIANATDRQQVFLQLEATRGVDFLSDGIDRYAEDSLRNAPQAYRFFPDWGIFMSFVMLTHGTIPYSTDFSPDAAKAVLCSGQDAELVTFSDKPPRRLDDWIEAVAWPRHETAQINQGNGRPLLNVVRWRAADRPPGACT